jgi:hypothetical protein
MPLPADFTPAEYFDRLPRPVQTTVLIVLVGVIVFLALALDQGGETAFMYATF